MSEQPKTPGPFYRRQWFLSVAVLAVAVFIAVVLIKLRPAPTERTVESRISPVGVVEVRPGPLELTVRSQGTVSALTETLVTAEVSGTVMRVSESFVNGGGFAADEVLLEIDPTNYRAALADAKLRLAEARWRLAEEEAAAAQAREDWRGLAMGEPDSLVLREPQLTRARAAIEAAEAAVAVAEKNLSKTRVRLPYAGFVREKLVDLGQSVTANATALARVFSSEAAEVRLPLSLDEFSLLQAPGERGGSLAESLVGAPVELSLSHGRERYTRSARIARIEAAVDPRTRLIHVVARVDDPYNTGSAEDSRAPVLRPGLFVEAELTAHPVEEAVRLPRIALRDLTTVYCVEEGNRLRSRTVEVLRADAREAIIVGGLGAGDRVCVTPLTWFVEGMEVIPETISQP